MNPELTRILIMHVESTGHVRVCECLLDHQPFCSLIHSPCPSSPAIKICNIEMQNGELDVCWWQRTRSSMNRFRYNFTLQMNNISFRWRKKKKKQKIVILMLAHRCNDVIIFSMQILIRLVLVYRAINMESSLKRRKKKTETQIWFRRKWVRNI